MGILIVSFIYYKNSRLCFIAMQHLQMCIRDSNNTLTASLTTIKENTDVQFIWQTGKYYYPQVTEAVKAEMCIRDRS